MSLPLRADLVRSFSELEQLETAWDRLAGARPVPEVFHRFAWARAWWRGYAQGCEIFTPVVRDMNGEVVAIWPLVRCNSELRALGHGASDHNDLLTTADVARPALESTLDVLAKNNRLWSTGRVPNVSERGLLLEAARSLAGVAPVRLEVVRSGTGFATAVDAGPAQFAQLARKDSLRRHRKKLERLGPVSFRHIEDPEEIKRHLSILQRQHIQRWALRGATSHFLDPASKSHYEGLADDLSSRSGLRFGVLEVDGRPVAYHLGFERAGRLVWYKPTFDVDYSDFGPGEVLLQSVLNYCESAGIRELDYTIGDESYKTRFSNLTYDYFDVYLFSHLSAKQYALRARERLKRNPAFYQRVKTLRDRVSEFLLHVSQARQRNGLARAARQGIQKVLRTFVYRRDEVIVFRHSFDQSGPPTTPASDLEIVPLRWSLIAEAALLYPDYLSLDRIQKFRERIAAGDRCVIAVENGRVAHLAWVGKRTSIVDADRTGPNCVLALPKEVAVIYDSWTAPDFRSPGIFPSVLQTLVWEEVQAGREVWTCCPADDRAACVAILQAGFSETGRMTRTVSFKRAERCKATEANT